MFAYIHSVFNISTISCSWLHYLLVVSLVSKVQSHNRQSMTVVEHDLWHALAIDHPGLLAFERVLIVRRIE